MEKKPSIMQLELGEGDRCAPEDRIVRWRLGHQSGGMNGSGVARPLRYPEASGIYTGGNCERMVDQSPYSMLAEMSNMMLEGKDMAS
jgi:hypothetical protein